MMSDSVPFPNFTSTLFVPGSPHHVVDIVKRRVCTKESLTLFVLRLNSPSIKVFNYLVSSPKYVRSGHETLCRVQLCITGGLSGSVGNTREKMH